KQFLVLDREQQFLQQKNLPLPTKCPACRQLRRLTLRGGRTLYRAKCQKCTKEIITSYDPASTKNMILYKEDYERYFQENDPIITEPLPEN
ncbi:MAG: hypothetical protein WBO77_04935, partial [Microgenomates group bacterium]